MLPRSTRARDTLAILLLLLLPAVMLGDSVFGDKAYLPFDRAEFPPVSTTLELEEIAALRENANYDATEPPIWFLPEIGLVQRGIDEGTFPHWNPYVRGGAPLAANGHIGVFDPLHWPAFLFADPNDGLLYLSYAVLAMAGVLMYGLLRELALSRSAALFGAVAFSLCGTLTANGHWYMRVEPIALMPGILWALLRIDRTEGAARGLPVAMLAVAVLMCWTTGFPPFAVVVCLFGGLFGLALTYRRWRRNGAADAARFLAWFGSAFALGICMAAVQMLPMLEFYPYANRTPIQTLADQSQFAFDPMGLLGYLLPDVFSHPTARLEPGTRSPLAFLLFSRTEWGTGALLRPDLNYNFTEYSVFAGTLPLLLGVLGLVLRGPTWRFVALAGLVLTMLLAIGPFPFYLAHGLPGIESVPPFRFAALACVFVTILAALGFDRLLRGGSAHLAWSLAALAAIGAVGCLWTSHSLAADPAATERQWLEKITDSYRPFAREFDPNLAPEHVTPELVHRVFFQAPDPLDPAAPPIDRMTLARERLQRNLDRGGVALLLGSAFLGLLGWYSRRRPTPAPDPTSSQPISWWIPVTVIAVTAVELGYHGFQLNRGRDLPYSLDTEVHEFLRQQRADHGSQGGILVARANPGGGEAMHMPPGSLADDRIRDLHFYTFLDGASGKPMKRLYGEAFVVRDHFAQALPDDARLQLPWWDAMGLRYLLTTAPMQFGGKRVGPELRGPGGEFYVYERESALPRAWVVPELQVTADEQQAVTAIIQPDFAPRERAIITEAAAAGLPEIPADQACKARRVEFRYEDLKRLTLEVGEGPAGYLVVADTELPGWSANIDGVPVPIARANVYQRLVPIPAGPCAVNFRYRTPGLLRGLVISWAAVLVLTWLVIRALRQRRPRHKAADITA